jgi:hypothetical protein
MCWIDGAKTYIKQDDNILKRDPDFMSRRFTPPKRSSISCYIDVRPIQENALRRSH